MNISTLVKIARSADSTLRSMERNQRLGLYQGRNSDSTAQTMDSYESRRDDALYQLTELYGERKLVGVLTAEFGLARRMQIARESGQQRPELQVRLNQVRRDIRERLMEVA